MNEIRAEIDRISHEARLHWEAATEKAKAYEIELAALRDALNATS